MPEGNGAFSRIAFGVFELDLGTGELRKHGIRIRLQAQPFRVLEMLVEQPGKLVTREELKGSLWPADSFGDFDHGLNKAINKIREALGDSVPNPRFVETVARRGYRFIAAVTRVGEPVNAVEAGLPDISEAKDQKQVELAAAPGRRQATLNAFRWKIIGPLAVIILLLLLVWRRQWTNGGSSDIRSLAVLPLENLSSDISQEYFADGMTDELITALGSISGLRVTSRSSVMLYKHVRKPLSQIARELKVDAVVEGTVVRSEEQVRITAQLIRASTDEHLWSQSYEGDLRNA